MPTSNRFEDFIVNEDDELIKDNENSLCVEEKMAVKNKYKSRRKPKHDDDETHDLSEMRNEMLNHDPQDEDGESLFENVAVHQENKHEDNATKLLVNITSLLPEQLLMIDVSVVGKTEVCLLDTGGSNSLMRKSVAQKLGLFVNNNEMISFRGLGNKISQSLGTATTKLSYYGINVEDTVFHIVDDKIIEFPIILSKTFCETQKLVINMAYRKLSKYLDDKSRIDIYLANQSSKAIKIIHENIKVYASSNMKLEPGINEVKYEVNMFSNIDTQNVVLYYDGLCKNHKLGGIEGICESNNEGVVFIKVKDGENNHNTRINKGEVIGTVSTLIELEEEENVEEEWNMDNLKKKIDIGQLDENQKSKVYDALIRTKEALCKNEFDIGKAKVTPHRIELTDYTPIWQKPRRFSEPIKEEIDKQCKQLEMMDIIEKCNSPWSSPIVPVRKPNGSLRMCVDYRKINKITKHQNFPMPNLSDTIYSAHNTQYFTSIDLVKGYYQVPIEADSRQFTSFSTHNDQYQFKRLSFGLRNSGLQFQKHM